MSKKQPHLSWFSPRWEEPNLKWRVDCEWKLCWSEQNTGMLAVVLLLQCLWVMISPPTAVTWGSGQFDTQTHVNEVKFGQFLIYNLPQRWKLSRSAHVDQTNLNVFLFLTAVCKDFLQFAKTIKMTKIFSCLVATCDILFYNLLLSAQSASAFFVNKQVLTRGRWSWLIKP